MFDPLCLYKVGKVLPLAGAFLLMVLALVAARPVDARRAKARSANTQSGATRSGNTRSESRPGDARTGNPRSGDTRPAEVAAVKIRPQVIEKVLVIVGDQIITLSDLDDYERKLRKEGLVQDLLFAIHSKENLLRDRRALIDHLITEKIVDLEVKKQGITATIERVEQEIRNITAKNRLSRSQLKDALAQKGIVFTEYLEFIKSSIERQMLVEKVINSKIRITDEDLATAYVSTQGHKVENQVFEYTIAHILFLPEHGGDQAARRRAEKALQKLSSGQSFEKLVSQYTEEEGFSAGGLIGSFKRGEMSKDIERAVTNLSSGDNTNVVKTSAGYHIFKVVKKTLVNNPQFEAEKGRIREQLAQESFRRQLKVWLEQRRSETFIRVNS